MKLKVLGMAMMIMVVTAFAGEGNNYKKPVLVKSIGAKVVLAGDSVKISWKKYKRDDLKFYKVVKSESNKNPVYPEDGYIYFTEDANITSYVDKSVEKGKWYYRVCVITNGGDRWVSDVTTIVAGDKKSDVPSESDFE